MATTEVAEQDTTVTDDTNPSNPDQSADLEQDDPKVISDEEAEAKMIEAYNKLAGIEPEDTQEKVEPKSKVEKPVTEEETPDTNERAGAEGGGESDGGDADAIEPEQLEKSRNALKRWQYPDSLLDKLDPKELIERGTRAAQVQAEQDKLGNEKTRLQKMLEEIKAESAKKPKEEPGEKAVDPAASDGVNDIEPLLEELEKDEFYSPLRAPLIKAMNALEAKLAKQYEEKLSQSVGKDDQINALYQQIDEMNIRFARDQLKERFPKLDDPTAFAAVKNRVYELGQLSGYRHDDGSPDWVRLVTDAARSEGLDVETKQKQQSRLLEKQKKVADGQPTRPTGRSKPAPALDSESREMEAYKLLAKGVTPDEVRQRLADMAAA